MRAIWSLPLCAAICLLVGAPPAVAEELTGEPAAASSAAPLAVAPAPGASGPAIEFRRWQQGEPPLRLIRREEGVCALTSITGHFVGAGEEVRVYIGDDGYWYLGGTSRQHDVAAECLVFRFAAGSPPPAPAPTKHLDILAASYSFGSHFSDVTARVKELLRDGNTFQANPHCLLVDPQPGWNKALVIFCTVGGKRAIFSADEGESINRETILKKARPVSKKAEAGSGAPAAS